MTALSLDSSKSSVRIETQAVGMLAKLAHDLSIEAREFSLSEFSAEPTRCAAQFRFPTANLQVLGVRKGGAVDRGVLSQSDKSDIERKLRTEVLQGDDVVVRVEFETPEAELRSIENGRAQARFSVTVGTRSTSIRAEVLLENKDALLVAKGQVSLSLPALGITPPKGPLGAFRVKDEVLVVFELALR